MTDEEQEELKFLKWFYNNCDFGPADGDVRYYLRQDYEKRTGNKVPEGYRDEDYGY